ncbi:MAG: hypothetical protein ACHREM_31970, partial [Polyangiales bacterium]
IQAHGIVPDVLIDATRVLETKGEAPFPKERDLPHALAAEAPSASASASASVLASAAPSTAPSAPSPPMLHAPDLAKDYALRVAWGVLTGVVMKPSAR